MPQIQADLNELATLDITPLDTPEPELAYLFKHIVTHEVAYESLSYARRASLHEQLAHYLERIDASVVTLAQHYGLSENTAKQREYFYKAARTARKSFANQAALEYYARLLPLLETEREQLKMLHERGELYILIGEWEKAEGDYRDALGLAEALSDPAEMLEGQLAMG
ncbi:MAG TPA: hypothetical protein VLA32_11575, partial [Anaerolineales bacterium]|nr:hypothetical protein [Anaerolineales bacterium]